jgi:hypothetical protein
MKLELKYPCLADENEREDGAKYFTSEFVENSSQSLKFTVGPFKDSGISDKIDQYIKFKLQVQSSSNEENGFIFKKKTMFFLLKPQTICHTNMLVIADAMYDIILAFDVSVKVECSK